MSLVLGIDTSNYTTSFSLARDGEIICNLKEPVFVGDGQRGVRQSDAVFSHVKNIPTLSKKLRSYIGDGDKIDAVSVSVSPRDQEGSYMPCFLSGIAAANSISGVTGVPIYEFSHQRGHIYAALYSSGATELYGKKFIAFHVSGGTTEVLLVNGKEISIIGGTRDLTAGQLIDRGGVYMGLSFPCGAKIEELAKNGKTPKVKLSVSGCFCNMSGAENKVKKMMEEDASKEDISAYIIEFVRANLDKITNNVIEEYGKLPLVFSGGVMSCKAIKDHFEKKYGAYFASPEFSSDNAAGIALLGELELKKDSVANE